MSQMDKLVRALKCLSDKQKSLESKIESQRVDIHNLKATNLALEARLKEQDEKLAKTETSMLNKMQKLSNLLRAEIPDNKTIKKLVNEELAEQQKSLTDFGVELDAILSDNTSKITVPTNDYTTDDLSRMIAEFESPRKIQGDVLNNTAEYIADRIDSHEQLRPKDDGMEVASVASIKEEPIDFSMKRSLDEISTPIPKRLKPFEEPQSPVHSDNSVTMGRIV